MDINMSMEFEAGAKCPQLHISIVRVAEHFLLPLVVEDWCSDNCSGAWNINGDLSSEIKVSFNQDSDHTLFLLSSYRQFITV